jgi:hypothetical protein
MDAAAVLAEKYGKPAVTDHRPQGFVRGYAYVASTSVSRDARAEAAKAYDERSARIANAWQKKQQDADAPAHTQDAAQAKGLADSAWQGKKARLQNAWRAR